MASQQQSTRWMRGVTTLALLLLAASCAPTTNMWHPAGPIMDAEKSIIVNASIIMLLIITPTILLAFGVFWWFREGNPRAVRRPDFVYSGRVEAVVWSIPLLTILFLGGVAIIGSYQLDPHVPIASRQPPLRVQVVALDWKWLFIYPDQGVATVNYLALPAGRPVQFEITSSSVMNTFWVPRLGSMIYCMAGMSSPLNLMADRPGRFDGMSGHLSGDGFPQMHFAVDAVPQGQFDAWVAAAQRAGGSLQRASYMQLQRQSVVNQPLSWGTVQPALYDDIVSQRIPPGPGPEKGRGGRVDIMPRANIRQNPESPVTPPGTTRPDQKAI